MGTRHGTYADNTLAPPYSSTNVSANTPARMKALARSPRIVQARRRGPRHIVSQIPRKDGCGTLLSTYSPRCNQGVFGWR